MALGFAIHLNNGEYSAGALLALTVAIVLTTAGVWTQRLAKPIDSPTPRVTPAVPSAIEDPLRLVLTAGLAFQFLILLTSAPGTNSQWTNDVKDTSVANMAIYYAGVAVASFLALGVVASDRWMRVCFFGAMLIHLLLGVWMLRSTYEPFIDVWVFQQDASAELLKGRNPYEMTFPDIYKSTDPGKFPAYGPGLSVNYRLRFGFPYTPMSLWLAAAGYALMGDHRYAQLSAVTIAGLLMAMARPSRISAMAALLFVFTPRVFFILGKGWTEPFVVLLLAAAAFCAVRRWRILPLVLGLFLATKQYLLFAPAAMLLLVPRPRDWRSASWLFAVAVGTAALVTAPLLLWNPQAFFHSTWTVQKLAPFRPDALSYLVWWLKNVGPPPGVWLALIGALIGSLVVLSRSHRSVSGFAAGLALIYLPFIALNKQAFANYYFFVIGALCCAVAFSEAPGDDTRPPNSTSRPAPLAGNGSPPP